MILSIDVLYRLLVLIYIVLSVLLLITVRTRRMWEGFYTCLSVHSGGTSYPGRSCRGRALPPVLPPSQVTVPTALKLGLVCGDRITWLECSPDSTRGYPPTYVRCGQYFSSVHTRRLSCHSYCDMGCHAMLDLHIKYDICTYDIKYLIT